jgi:hypothetical protein
MADGSERRTQQRHPVAGRHIPAPDAAEGTAVLRDVSLNGAGVVVPFPCEVGQWVSLRLTNPARGFDKPVQLRVAHVTPTAGGFFVGGTFAEPLSFDELDEVVAESPPAAG